MTTRQLIQHTSDELNTALEVEKPLNLATGAELNWILDELIQLHGDLDLMEAPTHDDTGMEFNLRDRVMWLWGVYGVKKYQVTNKQPNGQPWPSAWEKGCRTSDEPESYNTKPVEHKQIEIKCRTLGDTTKWELLPACQYDVPDGKHADALAGWLAATIPNCWEIRWNWVGSQHGFYTRNKKFDYKDWYEALNDHPQE